MARHPEAPIERFYITKYALTTGIEVLNCRREPPYASLCDNLGRYAGSLFRLGTDAHDTIEAARARVAEMRADKIASLEKQIDKLTKLNPATAKVIDRTGTDTTGTNNEGK